MGKPKRLCRFTPELRNKYSFLKEINGSDSELLCGKCKRTFSISHGGGYDIERHIQSIKHKYADIAVSSSKSLTTYYKSSAPSSRDLEIAAAEGAWAYHTVSENQSFRSHDCFSKLTQACFEPKFHCARTKCEKIVTNVFAPYAIDILTNQLKNANCISILTDASNHGNIKLFSLLVRLFDPLYGIQIKILNVESQPGETSDIIINYIVKTIDDNNIRNKVATFCEDNTNCNFGGVSRRGTNNVFHKLQGKLGKQLIGVGCAAHIIHNAIQTAADCLPIDIECIIVKIYSFFYIYTVRVEELKDFCMFVEIEYKAILGYSKTRWLSLMPSVERILKLFPALKSYFLSLDKVPLILKTFFNDPCAELWLNFIHSQAATFHQHVLNIEGQNILAVEVFNEIKQLKNNLMHKKQNKFIPLSVRTLIRQLEYDGLVQESDIQTVIESFYSTSEQYLTSWTSHFEELEIMECITLKKVPNWSEIEKVAEFISNKGFFNPNNDTALFDQFMLTLQYVTQEKIDEWNLEKKSTDQRWVCIFKYFKEKDIQLTDMVVMLLETPFRRWHSDNKNDLLKVGKPIPILSALAPDKKLSKVFCRSFNPNLYQQHSWLCGSHYIQKLFCWPCLLLGKMKSVWNTVGYYDLKNLSRGIQIHQTSKEHIHNHLGLKNLEKNYFSILDVVNEHGNLFKKNYNENVRLNRLFMEHLIDLVLFLGKQELAFRGHDENSDSLNKGNFRELFDMHIIRCSQEIQNHYNSIKNIFSDKSELVERFLGFHNVSEDRTAQGLFNLVNSVLHEFDIENKLVGQCYDGACVMSGHLTGLQARVKKVAPNALFTHCLAHRLNLVLQHGCSINAKCRIFFANLTGIAAYFHNSTSRTNFVDTIVGKRIPQFVQTRWSSRSKILHTIVNEWSGFINVFDCISKDPKSSSESICGAIGHFKNLKTFDFAFLALVFNDIFIYTDSLFNILQNKSFDVEFCLRKINITYDLINKKRNEPEFLKLFNQAVTLTKPPKATRNESNNQSNFKILFYEIIDNILVHFL
ncbi:hypothetical protein QTP88_012898 [Uroleucon formosanum]